MERSRKTFVLDAMHIGVLSWLVAQLVLGAIAGVAPESAVGLDTLKDRFQN